MSIAITGICKLPDREVKISATATAPETTQKIVRMMMVINPLGVHKKTPDTPLSGFACYKEVATANLLFVEGDTVYVSILASVFDVEPADYCLVSCKGVPVRFFRHASVQKGPDTTDLPFVPTDIAFVPFGTWDAAKEAIAYDKGESP